MNCSIGILHSLAPLKLLFLVNWARRGVSLHLALVYSGSSPLLCVFLPVVTQKGHHNSIIQIHLLPAKDIYTAHIIYRDAFFKSSLACSTLY